MNNGKVTPIARHILALSDAQCTGIDSAIAEKNAATHALDQKLGLEATIIEQTEKRTVINLPNDAEARQAIDELQWKRIRKLIGTTKTKRLLGDPPKPEPWPLVHTLTVNHQDNSAVTFQAITHGDQHFNPQYSYVALSDLASPWKAIVRRLDVIDQTP